MGKSSGVKRRKIASVFAIPSRPFRGVFDHLIILLLTGFKHQLMARGEIDEVWDTVRHRLHPPGRVSLVP